MQVGSFTNSKGCPQLDGKYFGKNRAEKYLQEMFNYFKTLSEKKRPDVGHNVQHLADLLVGNFSKSRFCCRKVAAIFEK